MKGGQKENLPPFFFPISRDLSRPAPMQFGMIAAGGFPSGDSGWKHYVPS